ncbi:hypothetical protein AF332_12875 [Sporosarcina globispora]|uniref:DUF1641 domain-containing protein n=1 Tax=Sporosarcina globispora TaxID=1459 RepID=A0A0M0GCR2_SPOGL|nr:hypothetical protein [Sporosarcina globispora]KON87634.1 hypothetical protein AF332_12875 [Sporosarcina globispora]
METTQKPDLTNILQVLENDEQMKSLYYLLNKLPEFTSAIRSMEEKLAFIGSVMEDKQSLNTLGEALEEKVEKLQLDQEHFDAILNMVHLLPRLVPMVKRLDEIATFINDVLADKESIKYAINSLSDIVPLEKGLDIIKETNEQFKVNNSSSNISIFGIYRLLKDPMIQNGFKYIEILLDVIRKK